MNCIIYISRTHIKGLIIKTKEYFKAELLNIVIKIYSTSNEKICKSMVTVLKNILTEYDQEFLMSDIMISVTQNLETNNILHKTITFYLLIEENIDLIDILNSSRTLIKYAETNSEKTEIQMLSRTFVNRLIAKFLNDNHIMYKI